MIGMEALAGLLIGAGALAAAARFALLRRGWRTWALAALSLTSGAVLYFSLFPPSLPVGGEIVLVATAGTPVGTRAGPGERLVALPEAPTLTGAERVPDLATALRRDPQWRRLRILGRGLTDRDRDFDVGGPVDFTLPPPRGLVRLDPPADTSAGAIFALGGGTEGLEGGTAELLDPAGNRVDSRVIGSDGAFTLGGTVRVPGLALFTLRLRGRDKGIVSETPVPVRTLADTPVHAVLFGAPSPEAKYLRRWLEDGGIDLKTSLTAGGGIDLGGGDASLDPASLRKADVVIIDDAVLAAIGSGGRAALAQAIVGGLGVVVRMSAPATSSTRANWRTLGLSIEGGSDLTAVSLPPPAPDAEAFAARRGPGTADVPDRLNTIDDPAPDLGRWILRSGPDFVAAVSDADGGIVSGWQQRGEGRVAIWAMPNSFALVLNGAAERYQQWWSATVSAVVRPDGSFRPSVPRLVQVGERVAICGIEDAAQVKGPDEGAIALIVDPLAGARGCAAYWPTQAGVHRIVQKGRDGEQAYSFAVLPKGSLKTIRAAETAAATAHWAARQDSPARSVAPQRHGPAWPWFVAWLLLSGILWWGERRLRAAAAPLAS
jgi:hypothetical protein